MINKYYVVDLAPERSMIEYLVAQGQQVFAISWRNPDERHAEWGLDTYVQAVLDALEATEKVSGADKVQVMGLCAGGIVLSCALGASGAPRARATASPGSRLRRACSTPTGPA